MPESCIRRPSGLTDDEWDWLVEETNHNEPIQNKESPASCLKWSSYYSQKKTANLSCQSLKSIGIDTKKDLMLQNWGA